MGSHTWKLLGVTTPAAEVDDTLKSIPLYHIVVKVDMVPTINSAYLATGIHRAYTKYLVSFILSIVFRPSQFQSQFIQLSVLLLFNICLIQHQVRFSHLLKKKEKRSYKGRGVFIQLDVGLSCWLGVSSLYNNLHVLLSTFCSLS